MSSFTTKHILYFVFQVADTLVRAFPEEEESVKVSLREKYKSLLQRVKRCSVLGTNTITSQFSLSVTTDAFSP